MPSPSEFKAPFKGMSMFPTLRDGDELVIEPYQHQELKSGDILFYKNLQNSEWQAHRLLRPLASGHYLVKGDWSCQLDEPLDPHAIFGIVVGKKRQGKTRLWRQQGSTIRSLFSKISLEILAANSRLRRWVFRLFVLALHASELFIYAMKKPKKVINQGLQK